LNRFTGQVLDTSGLYWFGCRYYDPQLGRFIQPDSMIPSGADSQALNRYCYGFNNPLSYTDPSGHFAFLAVLAFLAPIAGYAAIGGAIGGLAAEFQGGDFLDGFKMGAIQGALTGFGIALSVPVSVASAVASAGIQISGGGEMGEAIVYVGTSFAFANTLSFGPPGPGTSLGGYLRNSLGELLPRTFEGALAGGTAAAMTGNDIGNGIKSGALGSASSTLAHQILKGVPVAIPYDPLKLHAAWAAMTHEDPLLQGEPLPSQNVRRYGLIPNALSLVGFARVGAYGGELALNERAFADVANGNDVITYAHELTHLAQWSKLGAGKFMQEYAEWTLGGQQGAYTNGTDPGARLEFYTGPASVKPLYNAYFTAFSAIPHILGFR